jgi:hypothetical protein
MDSAGFEKVLFSTWNAELTGGSDGLAVMYRTISKKRGLK